MFKPCLLVLIAAAFLSSAAPFAAAQNTHPSSDPHSSPVRDDAAQRTRIRELTAQLKLTSDQQIKAKDIFESERSQMESLRQDTSFPEQDRRAKMMEIHKLTDAQIRALLDSTQQKKWDKMQAEREPWMQRNPGWIPR